MTRKNALTLTAAGLLALGAATFSFDAKAQEQKPTVKIPQAGVPQVMTIEGLFVRAAYNNEGYAIIGYKTANMSVGDEWMLLEMGATLREGVSNYALKRDALSLDTPDGTKVPLASVDDYRKANLAALDNRAKVARDSINYFPPNAVQACRIGFFSDLSSPAMSWSEVELSSSRGCV